MGSNVDARAVVSIIAQTILVWEYFLTLGAEIQRYWKGFALTWANALFFINRYYNIIMHLPTLVEMFYATSSLSTSTCKVILRYNQLSIMASQLVVGACMIMRVYALYGKSRKVLCGLLLLAVAVIVVALGSVVFPAMPDVVTQEDISHSFGCLDPQSPTQALELAMAWLAVLLADLVCFVMTLWKAVRLRSSTERPLVTVVLRDGSMYFIAMVFANLANVLTLFLAQPTIKPTTTAIASTLSSLMMTRLMLNLRDPELARPLSQAPPGEISSIPLEELSTPYPNDFIPFSESGFHSCCHSHSASGSVFGSGSRSAGHGEFGPGPWKRIR